MKVSFIGSGGIAGSHLAGLGKFDDVTLAAFCDVDLAAAERRVAERGGRAFATPEEMLDVVQPEACYICVPPFAHGRPEFACIERGIPFFVEKPLGLDLSVIRSIQSAVEKKHLLTCVGYMNRYRHSVARAREILSADPAVLAHGGWISPGPLPRSPAPLPRHAASAWNPFDWAAPEGSWWWRRDKSGGQFLEQTTHTVDLVRYLLGEATDVFAHATEAFNSRNEVTIEDASAVTVKFRSGALACFYSAAACRVGGGISLTIHAMRHTLRFFDWEHRARFEYPEGETIDLRAEPDIFEREDRCFIDAVRANDPSGIRSSYADAMKTAELTLAASTSMRTGLPVKLGEST